MHTNSTTNYSLPQFLPTDKPAWLTDVNPAYLAIDNGMKANSDAASAAQTDATQALADAAGANAIATQADAKASGAIASLSEQFLDTNTYSVGEYVIFNNILYVCTEPVTTPGPWTGSVNWERASLDSIATALEAKTGSDIPVSDTDSTSIASKIAPLSAFIATPLFKRLTCNNITKELPASGSATINGNELIFSESTVGYTPVALASLYSTATGYFSVYDVRAVNTPGAFAIIRSESNIAQNVVSNFTVLFARNDIL